VIACLAGTAYAANQSAAAADCVTVSAPHPGVTYTYSYTDNSGGASTYTNQWEAFTSTASRMRLTQSGSRGTGASVYQGSHRIVDDLIVLERSESTGTDPSGPFSTTVTYSPPLPGDPATRVCLDRAWTIPSVSATNASGRGSFTVRTEPGTGRVMGIRESVTVPAGTFQTVHYTKILSSARGRIVDDYWKSIEHGVTVKHSYTAPGAVSTEVLTAVR